MQPLSESEMKRITEVIDRARVPYHTRPSAEDVARLVDDLITCGQRLRERVAAIAVSRRSPRAAGALADWEYFVTAGPLDPGGCANWNYARGLGRIVCSMEKAIREYQPSTAL
ncbi:hypothetical protein ABZ934_03005 [Streptomyces sp. NPDC046557]|uniref:hypothetical protein n=1 Tax=Streptomyces sp. NPDC046557 TaxID=3155372 RepID=UPI0033F6B4AA